MDRIDRIEMESPIEDLITLCRSHPDYTGTLVTSDLPAAVIKAVHEALEGPGDDLSEVLGVPGARGHRRPGECVLAILPPTEDDGWVVRFADTGKPKVDWPAPTPAKLEKKMREVVGNRVSELKALRKAIEDVWQTMKQVADEANVGKDSGPWESVPDRGSDEVLSEALIKYRKGQ